MEKKFKSLEDIGIGDVLIRRCNNERYRLESIIKAEINSDKYFSFWGFIVNTKGMKKFFITSFGGQFEIGD